MRQPELHRGMPGDVLRRYTARLGNQPDGAWPAADYAALQRDVLAVQSAELRRLYAGGAGR